MPRKLDDLKEGDLEPSQEKNDPGPSQEPVQEEKPPEPEPVQETAEPPSGDPGTGIMPLPFFTLDGPPLVRPEDDRPIEYIAGTPVMASEAATFGALFFKILGLANRYTGMDDSPIPEGKKPNYLRVTCSKCGAIIVTIAPQMEKYCSQCGGFLPKPSRFIPAKRDGNGGRLEGQKVVDAEYSVEDKRGDT